MSTVGSSVKYKPEQIYIVHTTSAFTKSKFHWYVVLQVQIHFSHSSSYFKACSNEVKLMVNVTVWGEWGEGVVVENHVRNQGEWISIYWMEEVGGCGEKLRGTMYKAKILML